MLSFFFFMKMKMYEKPELEELELLLEGSFVIEGTGDESGEVGGGVDPEKPGTGDNWD